MKICPCCKSLAFDDQERCFDCMRPFRSFALEGLPQISVLPASESLSSKLSSELREHAHAEETPSFSSAEGEYSLRISIEGFGTFERALNESNPRITIGRSFDNDLVDRDKRVSRHHAEIVIDGEQLWIQDLGARNLTTVDGSPLIGRCLLKRGSCVSICSMRIEII